MSKRDRRVISSSGLAALVKRFDWKEVARAIGAGPELLVHRDPKGRNWLHLCCGVDLRTHPELEAGDSIKLARLLLERGLGLNQPAFTEGSWQATPLWYAIARGHNLKLARLLLERGSSPNHCLWAAAFSNQLDAIRLLIKHGAEIDPIHEGETPFLAAIKWSRFSAAEVLLDRGADVDVRDPKGMTALHYMLAKNSDKAHFRMIVAHGARGDIPNRKGLTAAELISRKRDPDFRRMAERLARRS